MTFQPNQYEDRELLNRIKHLLDDDRPASDIQLSEQFMQLITQKQLEVRDAELHFLERLKLEFDANVSMSVGEKWSESDAAELLKKRIAELKKGLQ